jgi:hypothetical protein
MYDSRLNLCRQVAEDATEYFGPKVFGTPIPRNVRLAEAPSFGKPILLYDVQSVGAKSYLAVAQELLRRVEGTDVTIAPAQVAAATAHAAAAATASSAPETTEPEEPETAVAGTPAEEEAATVEAASAEAASAEAAIVEAAPAFEETPAAAAIGEIASPELAAPAEFAAGDGAPEEPGVPAPEDVAAQEYAPQEAEALAANRNATIEAPTETLAAIETDEAAPVSDAGLSQPEEALPPPETEPECRDGDRPHQAATHHPEPVIITAAPNATDVAPTEAVEDKATSLSHQSESKPEVTT